MITYEDAGRPVLPPLDRLNLQEARMGLAVSRRFRKALDQEDFDLAICNSIAGWWLSVRRPDVPMVNVFHYTMKGLSEGTLRGTRGYLPSRRFLPLFERVAARAKTVVAVSPKVRRELRSGYGIGSRVIENGVPMEVFRPMDRDRAREELGIGHDGPMAIFVGRADRTKGFDLVREVARLRPGLKILCITPGPVDDPCLMNRSNVSNDLMPLYYSAADLLLFPSRYESFGYTPLEAMACGLPVVASRTGIFEDLDDPRAGRLVDPLGAEAFARAADEVLNGDFDPRAVVGGRFSLDRFADQYRELARAVAADDGREGAVGVGHDPARS